MPLAHVHVVCSLAWPRLHVYNDAVQAFLFVCLFVRLFVEAEYVCVVW